MNSHTLQDLAPKCKVLAVGDPHTAQGGAIELKF